MTHLKRFLAPTALLAAFALTAAPGFAQEKYHGRENKAEHSDGERAQPRRESRPQPAPAPRPETRQEAPRAQQRPAPQPQPQAQQPQAPAPPPQRQMAQPRSDNRSNNRPEGRSNNNDNRRYDNRGYDNRGYDNRGYDNRSYGNRGYQTEGHAVPRPYAPHYEPHYAPHYSPRGYGYYGTRSYYRPYNFRPRFSIGFGIYAGFPVPYTYSYPYPITVYGYRAPGTAVVVGPNSPYYGGVALEMTPYDADVWVDGTYAGRVEDFDGTTQPLTLTTGMHELIVQAPGYEPMRVNVEIQPGQIIPYRGDLRPY